MGGIFFFHSRHFFREVVVQSLGVSSRLAIIALLSGNFVVGNFDDVYFNALSNATDVTILQDVTTDIT